MEDEDYESEDEHETVCKGTDQISYEDSATERKSATCMPRSFEAHAHEAAEPSSVIVPENESSDHNANEAG